MEDFEQDLKQIENQYHTLHADEPPAMLDQAILNKARLAVEAKAIRPWNFGWMHGTATAAVLVLGLTLVLQQRSEVPSTSFELDRLDFKELSIDKDGDISTKRAKSDMGAFRDENLTGADKQQQQLEESLQQAPADDMLRERSVSVQKGQREGQEVASRRQEHREAEGEVKQSADLRLNQAADTPTTESPAENSSAVISPAPASQIGSSTASSSTASSSLAKSPPVANQPARETGSALQSKAIDALQKSEEIPAAEASSLEESFSSSLATGPLSPDEWIAQILDLKSQSESGGARSEILDNEGQMTDWQTELKLFRESWPDYPLPPDLVTKADPEAAGKE